MKALRRTLAVVCLMILGGVLGGLAVHSWDRAAAAVEGHVPRRSWEATVYLPEANNEGERFADVDFDGAVGLLVKEFGGATLGASHQGYWYDPHQKIHKEPVRPVVVSFDHDRLEDFRNVVRTVGRKLGQQCVYYRLDEPRVELLNIEEDKARR